MDRQVRRDAIGVGVATGAYGISFGAIASAAGFSVAQAAALSLLMFTGASQFALVAVPAAPLSGAATAVLLGTRSTLYGLRLSTVLDVRGWRKAVAAQLVIDESSAMAFGRESAPALSRLAFWWTGAAVYVCWNAATVVGALGAEAFEDPAVLGLDAAVPAAFVALLAPRLRAREPWAVALGAAAVGLLVTPVVPAGAPVLCAALVPVAVGLVRTR